MIELSSENVVGYLRERGRVSGGEVLVEALSGGVANVVLKIFDVENGAAGNCFVIKQPLGKFKTSAEWLVDIERVWVEKECMELLGEILPKGSVPGVVWFDEENYVLAITCAPVGSVIWKKALLAGEVSNDAAVQAGMLLAMMHSATKDDAAAEKRYGDPKFFVQQRIDPYFKETAEKHPAVRERMLGLVEKLLAARQCLIHGDFSPKNIFLVPRKEEMLEELKSGEDFELSHLLLLDFEVAFYGHAGFDVATLMNHLVLKGFHRGEAGGGWRPYVLAADGFWETYRHTADPDLVRSVSAVGGHLLGALMLARVDGKSPAEYLEESARGRVREAALAVLEQRDGSIEKAMEIVGEKLN